MTEKTSWLTRCRAWHRAYLRRRSACGEIAQFDDRQLDDLGFIPGDRVFLARNGVAPSAELRGMLARLGLLRQVLGRQARLVELERVCVTCRTRGICRRGVTGSGPWNGYRAFCPNWALLDELVADHTPGRATG